MCSWSSQLHLWPCRVNLLTEPGNVYIVSGVESACLQSNNNNSRLEKKKREKENKDVCLLVQVKKAHPWVCGILNIKYGYNFFFNENVWNF